MSFYWKNEIEKEMTTHGESLDDVVHSTPTINFINVSVWLDFDLPGPVAPKEFLVWTRERVYFPAYSEIYNPIVMSVPRNPSSETFQA